MTAVNLLFRQDKLTEAGLASFDADLFLLPTNGAHPSEWELERILNNLGSKYISLVDNWDNFSSKNRLTFQGQPLLRVGAPV